MTTLPVVNAPQHPPSSIIDETDDVFSLSDRVSEAATDFNEKASLASYSSCDERDDDNDEVLPSSDLTPIKSISSSDLNNSNPQSGSIGTNSTKSNISPVPSTISEADSMSIRGACTGVDHQSEPALSTCGDRSYTSTSTRANHPYEKDVRKVFVGGLARSVGDNEFRSFFNHFGQVVESRVMIDRITFRSRGFGFVTFNDAETAHRVANTSNLRIHNKPIEIKMHIPKSEKEASSVASSTIDGRSRSGEDRGKYRPPRIPPKCNANKSKGHLSRGSSRGSLHNSGYNNHNNSNMNVITEKNFSQASGALPPYPRAPSVGRAPSVSSLGDVEDYVSICSTEASFPESLRSTSGGVVQQHDYGADEKDDVNNSNHDTRRDKDALSTSPSQSSRGSRRSRNKDALSTSPSQSSRGSRRSRRRGGSRQSPSPINLHQQQQQHSNYNHNRRSRPSSRNSNHSYDSNSSEHYPFHPAAPYMTAVMPIYMMPVVYPTYDPFSTVGNPFMVPMPSNFCHDYGNLANDDDHVESKEASPAAFSASTTNRKDLDEDRKGIVQPIASNEATEVEGE